MDLRPVYLTDWPLVRDLVGRHPKPNFLVLGGDVSVVRVALTLAEQIPMVVPVHVSEVPLALPRKSERACLLWDVAAMSLSQQHHLLRWMTECNDCVQVVSVASQPLWPLVVRGGFLDSLYYMLNTIVVQAAEDETSIYHGGAALC